MKKIRLLLVNNPITSLFMAAWFRQRGYEKDSDWRNILIYCTTDYDDTFSENIEEKKKIYEQACREALKDFVKEWVICMPKRIWSYQFDITKPGEIFNERKVRQRERHDIKATLDSAGIPLNGVKEIWFGNAAIRHHLFNLCHEATGVRFEHGIGEIYQAVMHGKDNSARRDGYFGHLPVFIKRPLRKAYAYMHENLQKQLIFFSEKVVKSDVTVSILGDEIKKANPGFNVHTVSTSIISDMGHSAIKNDPSYNTLRQLEGNSAVVLLENINWFGKTKVDYLTYFDSFENFLYEECNEMLRDNDIKNIIFKSKFFLEGFTADGFRRFQRLSEKFHLLFLPFYSERNYPIEYYLSMTRPKLILGCYSSGLYYAKKMVPDITTFSFDKWYKNYCLNHFQEASNSLYLDALYWIREFFHETHNDAFKEVLPKLDS